MRNCQIPAGQLLKKSNNIKGILNIFGFYWFNCQFRIILELNFKNWCFVTLNVYFKTLKNQLINLWINFRK